MPQKIIITTSPWKDYKNNKWMLSCVMNIQLDAGTNAKLSSFPDILKWMEKLQQAKFFVQWNAEQPKEITPAAAKWDKALYEKLFHGNINVKSFQPLEVSKLIIKSYPVFHVNNFVLDTYKEVGNLKSDELPKAKFYTTEFKKLDTVSQVQLKQTQPLTTRNNDAKLNDFVVRGNAGRVATRQNLSQNKAIPFSSAASPTTDFGQFHNFHAQVDKAKMRSPAPVKKPEFEYHDILSIITSYSVIMRKLGLVIDFELTGPPPAASGTVRILPANLSFENDVNISSPATAYQYTGKGFYVAAKTGSFIDKGMLKINSSDFSVVQMDTDGAAMKLANHADTVKVNVAKRLVERSNYIRPEETFIRFNRGAVNPGAANDDQQNNDADDDDDFDEGLPALRSAGIGIVKNGLADNMIKKLNRNLEIHKALINPAALLKNESLFNIEKAKAGAPSQPITAGGVKPVQKISAARLQDIGNAVRQPQMIPVATEILYADDLVFGYRLDVAYEDKPGNWYSLHKRKNGYSFSPVGGTPQKITLTEDEEIDEGCLHISLTEDENDEEQDQKISEVLARWEGWSLAVPRIGKALNNEGKEVSTDEEERKKYQLDNDVPFRLQVDLKPAPKTLPMLRFGKRYRVKVRTVDIAGNGLPHDVMPENEAAVVKTAIKYLRYEPLPVPVLIQADEVVAGDKDKMRDRDGESVQHMVIRSNYNVAAQPYEQNNKTTIVIDGKAAGTLNYLHEAVRFVTAPRASQYSAELHGMFDDAFTNADKAKATYAFIKSRDKEVVDNGKTKAAIIPVATEQVDIDYLADPMAAGVIFTMKSNTTFETSWKKGENRKFSFYFDEEVNDSNANKPYTVEQWKTPRSFKIRLVEGNAAPTWSGRTFIISLPKSAQVEITYASFWRPDDLDKISGLLPQISTGINSGRVTQHARKGVHWMFSPWRTIRLVHAVQQPLEKPAMEKNSTASRRNYEDTFAKITTVMNVHGSSTDKVDVEADWKEWADDLNEEQPRQISGKTHVATIPVLYTDKKLELLNAGGAMIVTPDMLPAITHSFNDTKHRMVNYTPVATTRYREYFTGIIETAKQKGELLPLTQRGDTMQLNILSSAKPAVPVIDYVVPSFNWIKNEKGNELSHLKTSNIRVYLKRPWYSSGDNEMLAVILPPKGIDPPRNAELKKYCTVWGKDPAFVAPDLNKSNYPQADHFPFAADYDSVKLAESDTAVSVAAYKVLFDKEKQRHYADIPINVGFAYFPFVRLTLARYQRHSVRNNGRDCCLSNTVQADWLQIVPARATAVTFGGSRNVFNVAVKGIAPFSSNPDKFAGAANNARVKINITVENTQFAKTEEAFISINDRQTRTMIWTKDYNLNFRQVINGAIDFNEKIEIDSQWSGKPFRIVIREYELHEFDPIRTQARAFTTATYHEYAERLVFMDVFEAGG